jgi:hypothetical protein
LFLQYKHLPFHFCQLLLFPLIVPDRASGSCPDPEILGTDSGEECAGGGVKPSTDLTPPDAERAAVETQQQWKEHEQKVLPTLLKHDAAESAANRMRTLYTYIHIL